MNTQSDPNSAVWLLFCIAILIAGMIHWIPTAIAVARNHPWKLFIATFNFFLGWTGIVWFLLLAWSLWDFKKPVEK